MSSSAGSSRLKKVVPTSEGTDGSKPAASLVSAKDFPNDGGCCSAFTKGSPFTAKSYDLKQVRKMQALVRGHLDRKFMKVHRMFGYQMPRTVYEAIVGVLLIYKVSILVTLALCLTDIFTVVPPPARVWYTPFEQNQHEFGVSYNVIVTSHLTTACLLVVCLFIPIFSKKGYPVHRYSGRCFVGLWLAHMTAGLANAIRILIQRGFHEDAYPTPPGPRSFPLFLFLQFAFLASIVIDFLITGLGCHQFKIKAPRSWKWFFTLLPVTTIILGLILIGWSIMSLASGTATAVAETFAIIYLVEFPAYIGLSILNMYHWSQQSLGYRWRAYMLEHERNMAFVAIITLLTFAANINYKYCQPCTAYVWVSIEVICGAWAMIYYSCWKKYFFTHPATHVRHYMHLLATAWTSNHVGVGLTPARKPSVIRSFFHHASEINSMMKGDTKEA